MKTHGTLTAEQVMSISSRHQPDYCSDTHVCFDWQAIADELNAELGSGTCEQIKELREAARSIQGNLGRCLYKRKDVDEMQKVSDLLFKAADTIESIGNDTLTAEQVRKDNAIYAAIDELRR